MRDRNVFARPGSGLQSPDGQYGPIQSRPCDAKRDEEMANNSMLLEMAGGFNFIALGIIGIVNF